MSTMRAKLQVSSVFPHRDPASGETLSETLNFHGVSKSTPYPDDGSDEDNTFAKWSPSVCLQMQVTNPALFGQFEPGQKYYVDFSPAS